MASLLWKKTFLVPPLRNVFSSKPAINKAAILRSLATQQH